MLKQAGLTLDEKEALEETLDGEGYKVLVNKILPSLLELKRQRLFSQTLTDPDSFQKLALIRAEIDGAKQLVSDVKELKKFLKSVGN